MHAPSAQAKAVTFRPIRHADTVEMPARGSSGVRAPLSPGEEAALYPALYLSRIGSPLPKALEAQVSVVRVRVRVTEAQVTAGGGEGLQGQSRIVACGRGMERSIDNRVRVCCDG